MKEEDFVDFQVGLELIANSIHKLGTGDAATPMGAIELLANEIKEGSARIAEALEAIAQAIERHGAV